MGCQSLRASILSEYFGQTGFVIFICARVKSRYIGDGHPAFNRNPYDGYINPYYWVDDHPLLYGNNGSLDPSTFVSFSPYFFWGGAVGWGVHQRAAILLR